MENGKYLNHGIPGPRGSELKGISVPFSAYFWYSVVNSPSNVFVDEVPNYLDDFDRHEFLKTMTATCQKTAWVRLTQVGWTEADLEKERKSVPEKLAIAVRLRKETTLTVKEIVARLWVGIVKSKSPEQRQPQNPGDNEAIKREKPENLWVEPVRSFRGIHS